MAWVRLDDTFPEHPKLADVGGDAGWLHVCAIAYCSRNLTDGFIPSGVLRQLSDRNKPGLLATKLVEAGLWERTEGGFAIHDYLDYNPTRVEVEAERANQSAKKAEAGRLGGIASGVARRKHNRSKPEANTQANTQAKGKQNEAPTRPDPTPLTYISEKTDDLLPGVGPSSSFSAEQTVAHQLARLQARDDPPENIERWLPATRRGILYERREDIERALNICRGDIDRAVDALRPGTTTPVREAWYADPFCECGGDGWQTLQDNTFGPCDCRRAEPYMVKGGPL